MNFGQRVVFSLLVIFLNLSPLLADSIRLYNGKWVDIRHPPMLDKEGNFIRVEDHYQMAKKLFEQKNYHSAAEHFMIVVHHFEETDHRSECLYYAGVSYFLISQFNKANDQFSAYLEMDEGGEFFDQVFEMKFHIAEQYRLGNWKTLMKEKILEIYEEVIVAGRDAEVVASALYGKGDLLKNQRDYKSSLESLESLTKRYPKHPLAAESYILMAEVYLLACERETQNPDFLDLARLNCQHFEKSFPGDNRIEQAKQFITNMEETYASSLYEIGRFYEKKNKNGAASVYYKEALKKYPESQSAAKSRERLELLT